MCDLSLKDDGNSRQCGTVPSFPQSVVGCKPSRGHGFAGAMRGLRLLIWKALTLGSLFFLGPNAPGSSTDHFIKSLLCVIPTSDILLVSWYS